MSDVFNEDSFKPINPHYIVRDNLSYIMRIAFGWLNDWPNSANQKDATVCFEMQVVTHLRLLISCARLMHMFVCYPDASLQVQFDNLRIIAHTVSGLKYLSDEESNDIEDSVHEVCMALETNSSEMKEEFRVAIASAIRCLIEPTREQCVGTYADTSNGDNARKRVRTEDTFQMPEKKTETNAQFIQRVLRSNIENLEHIHSQIMNNPDTDLHGSIRSIFDCIELCAMWDFESEY